MYILCYKVSWHITCNVHDKYGTFPVDSTSTCTHCNKYNMCNNITGLNSNQVITRSLCSFAIIRITCVYHMSVIPTRYAYYHYNNSMLIVTVQVPFLGMRYVPGETFINAKHGVTSSLVFIQSMICSTSTCITRCGTLYACCITFKLHIPRGTWYVYLSCNVHYDVIITLPK